jgi:hypothetical protein
MWFVILSNDNLGFKKSSKEVHYKQPALCHFFFGQLKQALLICKLISFIFKHRNFDVLYL